jgi:hypothetical protein
MLNIAESVPSTEPVPSDSRNSEIQSKRNKMQPDGIQSNSFQFRSDSIPGIAYTYWGLTFDHTTMHVSEVGTDSSTEFLEGMEFEWSDFGKRWNWWELMPVSEPVPNCSRSRNGMYSHTDSDFCIFSLDYCFYASSICRRLMRKDQSIAGIGLIYWLMIQPVWAFTTGWHSLVSNQILGHSI